jgi:hypothetical protein
MVWTTKWESLGGEVREVRQKARANETSTTIHDEWYLDAPSFFDPLRMREKTKNRNKRLSFFFFPTPSLCENKDEGEEKNGES